MSAALRSSTQPLRTRRLFVVLTEARPRRCYSEKGQPSTTKMEEDISSTQSTSEGKSKAKTQAELDKELQLKLQGLAGDGGDAGIEFEDGKPVSMKRSVKNNMFRYI